MKLLLLAFFYSWSVILLSSCAGFAKTLNETDWSMMGGHMHRTAQNIQKEQHEQKMKPQTTQIRPVGAICNMELVENNFYGHYESVEVCQ